MPYTTHEDLIARIEAAFPDVPFPKDKQACDCRCDECQDLEKELQNKRWTEFTPTEVRYISAGTSLYNSEAFAYILPAYLRASLIDSDEADVATEYTAWKYIPDKGIPPRDMGLLTQPQREVLLDWLEWWVIGVERNWEDLLAEPPDNDRGRNRLRKDIRNELANNRQRLKEWQEQATTHSPPPAPRTEYQELPKPPFQPEGRGERGRGIEGLERVLTTRNSQLPRTTHRELRTEYSPPLPP